MRKRIMIPVAGFLAAITVCAAFPGGIYAYLTDAPPVLENNFTIALDSQTSVLEEFPDVAGPSYEKAVQIANTGFLDAYVRVRLDFTEDDIASKTQYSSDGSNYYSVSDYNQHLPAGWTYNSQDGWYYYTPILSAEGWETQAEDLVYDEAIGEYFYKDGQALKSASCLTTPLVQHVKTNFDSPADMRSYDLIVSSESVPFYFGSNYQEAWTNYLNDKGMN